MKKNGKKVVIGMSGGVDSSVAAILLKKEGYEPVLFMQLTSGSVINIKPELVLEALFAEAGEEYHSAAFQIHRLEMYGDRNMKKGEVHTLKSTPPCELVSLAEYKKR